MKRYIKASSVDNQQKMREAWEYIAQVRPSAVIVVRNVDDEISGYIDTEDLRFNLKYYLASALAQEIADRKNFFENSIGMWSKVRRKPNRDPDYTSGKWKTVRGEIEYKQSGSVYWYESDGVYRRSDHWGKVASCTWPIDEENARITTGFIKWDDLKPKGTIWIRPTLIAEDSINPEDWYSGDNLNKLTFEPDGFTFEKPRYYF